MRYFKDGRGQVYAWDDSDIDVADNLAEDTPQVFRDIAEKIKGMTELKGKALELHLNPLPTDEGERANRDGLLAQVDQYASNPLRWSDTSQNDKDAISAYRQLLLDVPQQAGFPLEIEWPELPLVLQ